MGRKGKQGEKGPVRCVESNGQVSLFAGAREGGKRKRRNPEVRFKDPDPEGIVIGRMSLREHLERGGNTDVLRVREVLREMDWSEFEGEREGGGRRPYHPAILVGLTLFGLMEGRRSLRQLETMAACDVRSWWLSGGVIPDHTVIGRFLNRHRERLTDRFFERLTRRVLERTGGSTRSVGIDGTVVQAAASRYRSLRREAARQAAEEARREAESKPGDVRLGKRAEQAEEAAQTAERRVEARRRWGGKADSPVVSPSEPEAVIQPLKDKSTAPSYQPSAAANEQRVIVAQAVDPSSETAVLGDLLEQAGRVGEPVRQTLQDPGYHSIGALRTCLSKGVEDVLCPPGPRMRDGEYAKEPADKKVFAKGRFQYDEADDSYRCPAGGRLKRLGGGVDRGRKYKRYGGAACGECPLRDRCTRSSRGRQLKRWEGEELLEAEREVMRHPKARERYRRRRVMIEPVFAELKHIQGLTRFRRRGLAAVRLEFSLHAMAHNLRRMLALEKAAVRLSTTFLSLLSALPELFPVPPAVQRHIGSPAATSLPRRLGLWRVTLQAA